MKISIVITKPASVYHPGNTVSGFVRLVAITGDTVRKVSIDFYGTATSATASNLAPYIERITLVSKGETLYAGADVLKAREHQWPFTLTIPERCEGHESQKLSSGNDAFFNGSSRQSLPPSFEDVAHSKLVSAVNRIGDESAVVVYYLKASFFENHESDSKLVETKIPLNVQPRRGSEHPPWDTTTHLCRFQIPLQNSRRASLSNIFTNRKSHNQEDAIGFSLRARMATTLVVGKPIPIFLLLEHDIQEETSGPRSAFTIRSIAVTLAAETSIRGHSTIWMQHPTGENQSTWQSSKQIGSKLTYSVAIQNGGILDIRSLIPDLIVPDSQTPSFATFNIVHIHSLKLKVDLMYHDRSFTARFIVKRVILLPASHNPINTISEQPYQEQPHQEPPTQATCPSPNPPPTIPPSTYPLRRAIDEEFESTTPANPVSDDQPPPPSFETAISAAAASPTTTTTSTSTSTLSPTAPSEDPPPFAEAVLPVAPALAVVVEERRGSTLHSRLSLDDEQPPPFDSVMGEEELPGYAREETY
ncbi:MAG: hypothetical protein GOMPHAMPRED_002261 [Gomphillus americanus]|uniref:Uncharacterized protein n=1 Tax=Gomphillus americanus TaxID=1940652 RepID=A0A8H3IHN8_9LECA|nr:MAG: hypothetical protein GOMPHAMPRED_002261 [Gomphillus americanus]